METLDFILDKPLEGILADFIQKEMAVVGALHAALAVLRVAVDIGALSGEEQEIIDGAAANILEIHTYCMKRAELRRSTLSNMQSIAVLETGDLAEIVHVPDGTETAVLERAGYHPLEAPLNLEGGGTLEVTP